jgi:4-hydroxy-tetrahydrodipicolinate reductase
VGIPVSIAGHEGRMGQALVAMVRGAEDLELVGRFEAGDPPGPALVGARVVVDFTTPEASLATLAEAAERGVAAVIGTTGWSEDQSGELARLAERAPIVLAPNFSTGVAVLARLVAEAARLLGAGYDIEVLELHHRDKADAPSGTALKLAEAAAGARGTSLEADGRFSRHGRTGPRGDREIGLQALRGGDAVGEHTVMLLGDGERLELTHRAGSRDAFAAGALRAVRWVDGRPPGLYSLEQVLGLS